MNKCERDKALGEARGYLGQMDWLEKMSKRYTQEQCQKCKLWHIFRVKEQHNG